MKKDYCPKCKTKNLTQIYQNYYKCINCLYTEEQSLTKHKLYKQTTTKPAYSPQRALKTRFVKTI